MARRRIGLGLTLNHSLSLTHNSTKILDYLYLGGQEATSERATLEFLSITHILNVSKECGNHFPGDYKYLQIPITDDPTEDASRYFDEAHDFIESAKASKQCVLVHCQTGMSRSTTMVLAHMLRSQPLALKDALNFVKARRPRASPNAGFMAQLVEDERKLRGSVSIDIERYRMDRFGDVPSFAIGPVASTGRDSPSSTGGDGADEFSPRAGAGATPTAAFGDRGRDDSPAVDGGGAGTGHGGLYCVGTPSTSSMAVPASGSG